jgi:hypothetical protein
MNTIKKVIIVVVVLIMSCHVSEKPKAGPDIPQIRTRAKAESVAAGLPAARVTFEERIVK